MKLLTDQNKTREFDITLSLREDNSRSDVIQKHSVTCPTRHDFRRKVTTGTEIATRTKYLRIDTM